MHRLGAQLLSQRSRVRNVAEEDGDLLPFTFEGAPRSEDLLREMLRGVRVWRAEPRLDRPGCRRHRSATAPAELLAALVQEATRVASGSERQPTLTAETASLTVLCVAPRTEHQRSFPISVSVVSSQNRMSISRYIVVAVTRCSCASCSLPARR